MALYSCSISNIKRSDGRSSVAKAAYNSRSKLEDLRTGNIYNYSQKEDLGFSEIIIPKNAPEWANERQQLWSKNELANKRRDARVAKEILVALPRELDTNEQLNLVRKFVAENLTPLGVVADVNAHELDPSRLPPEERADWNPHAHILISTQHIENGEFGRKITELNQKDFVLRLRESWANQTNKALEAAGSMKRVDHRSNQARGINQIPQIHLGSKVWAMKQKGIATERGDQFLAIQERNQEIDNITAEVTAAINHQRIIGKKLSSDSPEPTNNDQPKKKSWWQKATDFVFGGKAQEEESTAENQRPRDFVGNSSQQFSVKDQPGLEQIQTVEQKKEVAIALVKQIENQSRINQRLRTIPGKLIVLTNKNQIIVYALESGKDKSQQEKLILKRDKTGWKILKYKLNDYQQNKLLQVLKEVEQEKLIRQNNDVNQNQQLKPNQPQSRGRRR